VGWYDGCERLRLRQKKRPSTTNVMSAIPPTAPPIAAFAGVDRPLELEVQAGGFVASEGEDEDVVEGVVVSLGVVKDVVFVAGLVIVVPKSSNYTLSVTAIPDLGANSTLTSTVEKELSLMASIGSNDTCCKGFGSVKLRSNIVALLLLRPNRDVVPFALFVR
jgi:hypothetical protein